MWSVALRIEDPPASYIYSKRRDRDIYRLRQSTRKRERVSKMPDGIGREVLFEIIDEHIALVTLNRPEKRNAVNGAVAAALDHIVKHVEADNQIYVAILAS